MDLNALREAAIEATARALYDRHGEVPSEDSDEWEEEYRRQFSVLKQRHGGDAAVVTRAPPAAPIEESKLPVLSGTPEQIRWAASIRLERLGQIPSAPVREFLAQNWTRAKQWIDTRDVPTPTVLQRLKPQYDDYRKKREEAAKARAAETKQKTDAIAAYQRKLNEAGITPEGLVEMIDASNRFAPAPLAAKLAEVEIEYRHLRVYETADPNLLLIKERKGPLHEEYAIERDEGLVGDLKLFAQKPAP
ncbi:MAG TPA: hypothetical protein VHU15_12965 [Stellaceae bacterium]|jgi:hypothetical protein|nr:hypothetical protein [Stellaceae bacterium]